MAYVRTKGNQVLLVHGVRNPDSGAVEQQTLFTFYTKAEIAAALGEHQKLFRGLLDMEHQGLRLDWTTIDQGLREHIGDVPDDAPSRRNTVAVEFRCALVELTRVAWELDAYNSKGAWQVVQDNRGAISLIIEQLKRLQSAKAPDDHEFSRDSPSLWRQAARARSIPLAGWEQLDDLWDHCKYAEAESLAGLLAEAFPMFADGRNYLGLAAAERGDLQAALAHFKEAEAVGRKQFPRRIAKSRYWSDHDTRPFLRAIMHQVSIHNQLGQFHEALASCDRLARDYGQDMTANALSVPVLLNDRQWHEARRRAEGLSEIYPENNLLAALAALELRDTAQARERFIRSALQLPATTALLLGVRLHKGMVEDARDHNGGVALLRETGPYRATHGKSLKVFRELWSHPVVVQAVAEADEVRQKWRAERGGDRTWLGEMHRLHAVEHAMEVASNL